MRGLADERKNVRDGKRNNTGGGRGSLHRECLPGPCHTISEDGSMVAFHDPPDKAFGRRIVNLGIILVCSEDIVWRGSVKQFTWLTGEEGTYHSSNLRPLCLGKI